jgi:hypothetical protein
MNIHSNMVRLHIFTLLLGLVLSVWQSDAGGALLLSASAFFLILDRVELITADAIDYGEGQACRYPRCDATELEIAHQTITRFQRRQALLAEILSADDSMTPVKRKGRCIEIIKDLDSRSGEIDKTLHALRIDVLSKHAR